MSHIVVIQSSYHTVELGLFDGTQCLDERILDKKEASSSLIPALAVLCEKYSWRLADVQCIVTNQGPGPFTLVRTVLATVNGLSFALKIPLIGIHALEAIITEFDPDNRQTVVAVFNAFGGDVYYGIRYAGVQEIVAGVCPILDACAGVHADTIQLIGGAASSNSSLVYDTYGDRIKIHTGVGYASLKTVANMGIKQWKDTKQGAYHLSPLYLKNLHT